MKQEPTSSSVYSPVYIMDAHCHLADPRYESLLDGVIERSRAVGVRGWIQGGISPQDWVRQLAIQKRYGRDIVTSFGLHPWWVIENSSEELSRALGQLETELEQAQALGETGLDYHSRHLSKAGHNLEKVRERQKYAFTEQLKIARRLQKPLILHIVQAHGDALEALTKHGPFPGGGIIHAFSGSREVAKRYIELGFLISIGSAVTRPGFETLKRVIKYLPLEKIVVETDAPDRDLSEPSCLIEIARAIAILRGTAPSESEKSDVSAAEVLEISTAHLRKLFRLPF